MGKGFFAVPLLFLIFVAQFYLSRENFVGILIYVQPKNVILLSNRALMISAMLCYAI